MKKIVIGVNYLTRWYVIPRNKWFNVYLHKFTGSDDDRACHDHPWWSVSFLLKGKLEEVTPYSTPCEWAAYGSAVSHSRFIMRFIPMFRSATHMHRIVVHKEAWTLFITGPRIREWGFLCPKGWQHWRTMTDGKGNQIGGCE